MELISLIDGQAMIQTPRSNQILFAVYIVLSLATFIAALVSPVVRSYAYAPLRDLLLPPPAPITLSVLYSTEKSDWMKEEIQKFQAANLTLDGHPIQIKTEEMGSREMYLAVLDGTRKPDIISPASTLQTSILRDLSTSKFGAPVIDSQECRSVFSTPLVLVGWKERVEALWGSTPGPDMWNKLHDALLNPKGWEAFNHPEWGYVKFGHTDPLKSNSGFMTILLMSNAYVGQNRPLTSADILSNTGYQTWFLDIENTISQFGESTGTYMKDMIAYGPSVYDLVAVYEATAIGQADNAVGHYGQLEFFYPPVTILSDHPYCTLQASWVTPEKSRAAKVFIDYLLQKDAQQSALLKYGFRPADLSIPLDQPASPFQRYANLGVRAALPQIVPLPDGGVLNTLLDFWARNIRR